MGRVVVAVIGATYFATAAPHILGGDNGEFATLLATGGVAHPPGFPLYVWALRAFRWLPTSPAHAAALVTAAIGTATVYVLHRACLAWGSSPGAAACIAAVYGSSSLAWKLSTHAEVFALNALIAAGIVLAAAPGKRPFGWRKGALLGLLAGLGVSNHTTIVLLAPVGLWAFATSVREERRPWRTCVTGIAGLAIGLAPYAYLYHEARHASPAAAWVWGHVHDLRGIFDHFRRAEYGTFGFAPNDLPPDPVTNVGRMCSRLVRDLLGAPLVVLAASTAWISSRARREATPVPRRVAWAALAASFVLAGPALALRFNRPLEGVGHLVVERFYLLPMIPLAVLAAPSLDALLPSTLVRARAAFAIAVLALAAGFGLSLVDVREYLRPSVELYVRNTLQFLPPGTVVFGLGDHHFAGFLYARRALVLRPDVEFVGPKMLALPWYYRRVSSGLGLHLTPASKKGIDAPALAAHILGSGRPVAIAGPVSERLRAGFSTFPLGPVVMLLPPGSPLPGPDSLEAANAELYASFRIEAPPASPDSWAGLVHEDYARTWTTLESAFRARGSADRADACRARALVLAPWIGK